MGRERLGQVAPSDLAEDFPWQGRPQALGKRWGGGRAEEAQASLSPQSVGVEKMPVGRCSRSRTERERTSCGLKLHLLKISTNWDLCFLFCPCPLQGNEKQIVFPNTSHEICSGSWKNNPRLLGLILKVN